MRRMGFLPLVSPKRRSPDPSTRYEQTEAISLAFITALQVLPPEPITRLPAHSPAHRDAGSATRARKSGSPVAVPVTRSRKGRSNTTGPIGARPAVAAMPTPRRPESGQRSETMIR
jgi:hypothetical protein